VQLAVVVVTYNSSEDLPALLESIPRQTSRHELKLIVVDNDSSDDSLAVVRAHRPDAEIVSLNANLGYSAGVNAGWARADDADALLLLNPDLVVAEDAVDAWVSALESDGSPRPGIVVPRIVDGDGTRQPSLRRAPTALSAWAEAVLGGTTAGRIGLGELIVDPAAYDEQHECAWATGAAMLISRECLAAVGPWDERFFLYAEETDFCLRAGDAGFVTRLEPSAEVLHRGGDMAVSPPLYALMTWNRVRLQRKRSRPLRSRGVMLGAGAFEAIRWVAGSRRDVRRAALLVLFRPGRRSHVLPPPTDLDWNGKN